MNNHHSSKTNYYYLITDQVILSVVFFVIQWYLSGPINLNLPKYIFPFVGFNAVWIIVGLVINKYYIINGHRFPKKAVLITVSDLFAIIIALIIFKLFNPGNISFRLFLGLGCATYILEIFVVMLLYIFKRSVKIDWDDNQPGLPKHEEVSGTFSVLNEEIQHKVRDTILEESGENVLAFLQKKADLKSSGNMVLLATDCGCLLQLKKENYNTLINLRRVNDIPFINKFFSAVNSKLPFGGKFIGCIETLEIRKHRLLKKIPFPVNYVFYFFDFLLNRLASKLQLTKDFYFYVTSGYSQVISKAEVFGRLYACGFKVMEEREIDGQLYFIAKKINLPLSPVDVTYGGIVGLKRIGKEGKRFYVFKLRTMHPYAEYLQQYVYEKNHLQEGGKFNNDFRISTLGRWARKIWIDEFPMFVNIMKGEMKLIGVRPLSEHYFNLYTKELQRRRILNKPGLLPPFYADMPRTLEEIMASESRYLDAYEKHPFLTDWKYFWKIMYSIFIKRATSH